ncbi:hypothetical protein D0T60_14805 [Bacteroides sp. 224]|nr:hypothetical protein [Bacteroides sp. 224]
MLMVACQGDEMKQPVEPIEEELMELSVQIRPDKTGSSRGAEDETAISIVPHLNGTVLFLMLDRDSVIQDVVSVDADAVRYPAPNNGIRLKFNRNEIEKIKVIGNVDDNKLYLNNPSTPLSPATLLPAGTDWKATLVGKRFEDLQYDITGQGTGGDQLDPQQVNVFGGVLTREIPMGNAHLIVVVKPAISRIEIGGLKSTDNIKFLLEEIFVDNNFKKMGLNYMAYPTYTNDLIAFDWYNSAFTTGPTAYPKEFYFNVNKQGAGTAKPSPMPTITTTEITPKVDHWWSFYVAPAWVPNPDYDDADPKQDHEYIGNVIEPYVGIDTPSPIYKRTYSAMPMLIFKILLDDPDAVEADADDEGRHWITIKNYKNADTGERIHRMAPGYVYQIKCIEFTKDDVDKEPIKEASPYGIDAVVSVKDWTYVGGAGMPGPIEKR